MSAIEPLFPTLKERRLAARVRVTRPFPVIVGRGEGTLVDIGLRGARVRHQSAIGRGTTVRLSFEWCKRRFAATATVTGSRVIALNGPTYESRLHFIEVPHLDETVLRGMLTMLSNGDLCRAVENLHGLSETLPAECEEASIEGFIRCRYFAEGRWEKKWTRTPAQPESGFTLPAALSGFELAQVCRSYERIDAEGRVLLRQIADTINASSARTAEP